MMAVHNLESIDANIMFGIVNEKLRLEYENIDALLSHYELDKTEFEQQLEKAGFYYDPMANQLKLK